MSSPRHPKADVVLRDGSTVHVRPVRAEDAPAVRAFFERLSPRSIALRFFCGFPDLDRAVRWATEVAQHRYGLVATGADGRVVAHAGWEREPDRPERAEIAFAIADATQHNGLGTILLGQLIEAADQAGVAVLSAEVLPQNQHMLHVFGDSGIPVTTHTLPGVVLVELPTSRAPAALDLTEVSTHEVGFGRAAGSCFSRDGLDCSADPRAPEWHERRKPLKEEPVMADLRTRYLELELQSPLVASASPLTGSLDSLRKLEAAGAGAVVLPSLFEEELATDQDQAGSDPGVGRAIQVGYGAGPAAYHSLVEQAKQTLSIPVIASLNGTSRGGWVRHAARLEQAGADALELNIYYVSSRPGLSGGEVEGNYLDIVREVRRAIGIPLAVKLSPYFSSLANLAGQLVEAGANGLVLFNRFYQPDIDIEAMEVLPALELSSSAELRLPLRWIAILHRRWGVSLAASTGVHTATDVVKVLLAGADVAMMTSALLHNGPDHLRPVEMRLRDWMDAHRYETLDQLRGQLSQRSVPDPAAFERANYIKTLASRTPPRR